MVVYHGSKDTVERPELRTVGYNKDFYCGFYCTILQEQAKRWAVRVSGRGFLNMYEYSELPGLAVLRFPEMSEEWLDFIIGCRSGTPHNYDIVEGPMADDQIYNYIQDYIDGNISREAFWGLAKFRKPTHQISFHTDRALDSLRFIGAIEVHDEK